MVHQDLYRQHLALSDTDIVEPVQQNTIEIIECFQPRRSSRLAEKHQVQQIESYQPWRSVRIFDIARHCDVEDFNENYVLSKIRQHYAGSLFDKWCKYCNAYRWTGESESICCKKGNVRLPPLKSPPKDIQDLYQSTSFLDNVV